MSSAPLVPTALEISVWFLFFVLQTICNILSCLGGPWCHTFVFTLCFAQTSLPWKDVKTKLFLKLVSLPLVALWHHGTWSEEKMCP